LAAFARRLAACSILFGLFGAVLASAQPAPTLGPLGLTADPARGADIAYTCLGCHAIPGYRNVYPSYRVPKLGGQKAAYIEIALQGYRRGTRHHQTMQAQAAQLSDQDIADVAAYFASFSAAAATGKSAASLAEIEEGRRKATACVPCHGETGISETPQWPNLAGQHASYTAEALGQYKSGARDDLVMGPLMTSLDDETMAQLAAFFAAQPGLHTPAL
jgi:cytochrome c553